MHDVNVIPKNATIRFEYTKCGKFNCNKKHGPYHYAYWKDKGKLKRSISEGTTKKVYSDL